VLHRVSSFEFRLVKDVRERLRASGEHQVGVVRHYDIAEKKESFGAADIIEDIEEKVHFGRAEERDIF